MTLLEYYCSVLNLTPQSSIGTGIASVQSSHFSRKPIPRRLALDY
jgi:hypothetical protein